MGVGVGVMVGDAVGEGVFVAVGLGTGVELAVGRLVALACAVAALEPDSISPAGLRVEHAANTNRRGATQIQNQWNFWLLIIRI